MQHRSQVSVEQRGETQAMTYLAKMQLRHITAVQWMYAVSFVDRTISRKNNRLTKNSQNAA